MHTYFVFDTETSGLMPNDYTVVDAIRGVKLEQTPMLLSISYGVQSISINRETYTYEIEDITKPTATDNTYYINWESVEFEIPEVVTNINGLTRDKLATIGMSPKFALEHIFEALQYSTEIVAHNAEFDIRMLLTAIHHAYENEFISDIEKSKYIRILLSKYVLCTSDLTMLMFGSRLSNNYGSNTVTLNRTKLKDLHKLVYNKEHDDQHEAHADVIALMAAIRGWFPNIKPDKVNFIKNPIIAISNIDIDRLVNIRQNIDSSSDAIFNLNYDDRLYFINAMLQYKRNSLISINKSMQLLGTKFGSLSV